MVAPKNYIRLKKIESFPQPYEKKKKKKKKLITEEIKDKPILAKILASV
jgi:tRNA G46 methylase TrmB